MYGIRLLRTVLAFKRSLDLAVPPFDIRDDLRRIALSLHSLCQPEGDFDPDSADVQAAYLCHIRSIFDYKTPNRGDGARSPLVVMTYLFGIGSKSGQFLPPGSTTSDTAALTWLGRLAALADSVQAHGAREDRNQSQWEIAQPFIRSVQDTGESAFGHMRR